MTRDLVAFDDTEEFFDGVDVAAPLYRGEAEYVAVSGVEDMSIAREPGWSGTTQRVGHPVPDGGVLPVSCPDRRCRRASDNESPEEMARRTDVRATTDASANVILSGSHDRSWFDRLLHGSVGNGIIHDSTVPLLVIPAPAAHEGSGGEPYRQHRDGR